MSARPGGPTPPPPDISVTAEDRDEAASPLLTARSLIFHSSVRPDMDGVGGGRDARSAAAEMLAGELGGAHDDDRGHSEAVGRQRELIAKTTERMKSFRSMRAEEQSALHRALNTVTADLSAVRAKLKEETVQRYAVQDKLRDAQVAMQALEGDMDGVKEQLDLANGRIAALTVERDQLAAALSRRGAAKGPVEPAARPQAPPEPTPAPPSFVTAPGVLLSTARELLSWCEERCRRAIGGEEAAWRHVLSTSSADVPPEAVRGPAPQPVRRSASQALSDDVQVLCLLESARREALARDEARKRVSINIACENGAREWRTRGSASPPRTPRPSGAALIGGPLHEHPPWYPPGPPTAVFHGVRAPHTGGSRSATPSSAATLLLRGRNDGASPPRRGADHASPELSLTLKNMQRLLQTIQRKYAASDSDP